MSRSADKEPEHEDCMEARCVQQQRNTMRKSDGPRKLVIAILLLVASAFQARICWAVDNLPALRRPVSLVLADDRWLLVANRRSGSISVIDAAERRIADEVSIGRRLSDLVALPD